MGPFGYRWHCNWDVKAVYTIALGAVGMEHAKLAGQDSAGLADMAQITLFNLGNELGVRKTFTQNTLGDWVPQPGFHATLVVNPDATVTVTSKHGTVYQFAALNATGVSPPAGFLTSVTDRNGNTTDITYDGSGRISVVTDSSGRTLAFTYGSLGHIERVTGPTGLQYQYAYDGNHNLVQYTDPQGNTETYQYDADNRLVSIIDATGVTWLANTYDSDNRVVRQFFSGGYFEFSYGGTTDEPTCTVTDRNGAVADYVMNAAGQVTSETFDSTGLNIQTSYAYDGELNRVSFTDAEGNTTAYEYDGFGNRTKLTDAQGNETTMTYDPVFNMVTSVTDPLGHSLSYEHDSHGNVTRMIDALGNDTTYTYDTNGDLLASEDVYGNQETFVYNDYGLPTQATDALGGVVTLVWDDLGNLLSTTDPNDNTTAYSHDDMGRIVEMQDALSQVGTIEYDANGNPTVITDVSGTARTVDYDVYSRPSLFTDPIGNTSQHGYDLMDNVVSVTDANGNTVAYSYDSAGRLTQVDKGDGRVVSYGYDKVGHRTSVTDPQGNVTLFDYDTLGRLTQITYADSSMEQFVHDAVNNVLAFTSRDGNTMSFEYDELNRLVTKRYAENGYEVAYTYDSMSRPLSITSPYAVLGYSYDELGRVTQYTQNGQTVGYEYDTGGNRAKLVYPDAQWVGYTYDQLNRVTHILSQSSEAIIEYSYDAVGRRTGADLLNGTRTEYASDVNGLLTGVAHKRAGPGTPFSSFNYGYDGVGNCLSATTPEGTHTYGYDGAYELTLADHADGYHFPDTTYNYDQAGNRISVVDGGTVAYTDNNLNQYASVGGTSFAYDANGNLTYDGVNTYTYDRENQLVSCATGGGASISYRYDAFHRLVEKEVDGSVTRYIYDGLTVIAETDGSDTIIARYVHGPGMDEPVTMTRGGTTYYYHADRLGSVVNLTNAAGDVVESYLYDAFGQPASVSSVGNPYLFAGAMYDEDTGLYNRRMRYYSPALGRFMQPDPIGFWADANLYRYVKNNPLRFVDPLGLVQQPWYQRAWNWWSDAVTSDDENSTWSQFWELNFEQAESGDVRWQVLDVLSWGSVTMTRTCSDPSKSNWEKVKSIGNVLVSVAGGTLLEKLNEAMKAKRILGAGKLLGSADDFYAATRKYRTALAAIEKEYGRIKKLLDYLGKAGELKLIDDLIKEVAPDYRMANVVNRNVNRLMDSSATSK